MRALDEDYDGFAAFPPHGWTVSVAALLAEACLAMSPAGRPGCPPARGAADGPLDGLLPAIAGRLRVILARYAGEFVLAGWPSVLLGPAERFSGLLAMATGEYEEALHLFDAVAERVAGAPPQAARLQVNKARALIRLAQVGGGRAGHGRGGPAAHRGRSDSGPPRHARPRQRRPASSWPSAERNLPWHSNACPSAGTSAPLWCRSPLRQACRI